MTPRVVASIFGGLGVFAAWPALAQTPGTSTLRATFSEACQAYRGRDLPPEDTLAALMQAEGSRLSVPLLRAYQATLDGNAIARGEATLADQYEGAATLNLILRDLHAANFGEAPPPPSTEIQASLRTRGLDYQTWARAYLGGELHLITIHCAQPAPGLPRTQEPRRLIVAGDVAGLSSESLSGRSFATLSYSNDRETGAESFNIDVVVGLGPFETGSVNWIPYISYERESLSASPVNDLTFGATGFWRDNYHEVRWNAAYETDDDFESAVYQADLEWDPPPPRGCGRRIGASGILRCGYGFRVDYAQVEDAGAKTSLADVDDYLRIGGWMALTYGQALRDGWLEAELHYQLMEPLAGDAGDAARGRASVTLAPSERSNYRFGLTYENGEDITSLVRSEILKVTLGLRY